MKIQVYLIMAMCWLAAAVEAAGADDRLSGKELIAALRQGGYAIYFRHAATDWSRDDHVDAPGDWTSCDPQRMRQLSAAGRAVAQRIGEAIRRLNIPVGRVYSSEYCRTRDTARHMALGPVMPTYAIMNMRAAPFVGGREVLIDRARRALSVPPPAGSNTVFVAHGNLMQAVLRAYTGEAGAVVFVPRGEGEFLLLAQLEPEDWEMLARQFAKVEG